MLEIFESLHTVPTGWLYEEDVHVGFMVRDRETTIEEIIN